MINTDDIIRHELGKLLDPKIQINSDEATLVSYGADSLDILELLLILEEEHNLIIPLEKIDHDISLTTLFKLAHI